MGAVGVWGRSVVTCARDAPSGASVSPQRVYPDVSLGASWVRPGVAARFSFCSHDVLYLSIILRRMQPLRG